VESWEDSKQAMGERKKQVPCMIEEIYSRIQYLGRKGEFGECQGGN